MDIRKSIRKFFMGASQYSSSVFSWAVPGKWGKAKLAKEYTHYAYAIISAIAEEAAKVNLEIYKQSTRDLIPVPNHEFLKLMERPNPMTSQFQFLELHFTFMKLCGESYWYVVRGENSKKPRELYLLHPALMEVVQDPESKTGLLKGYKMSKGDGKFQEFELNEIIHHKMANPNDPYYGYSTMTAGQTYIETEKFASNWTRNSIYNSGRPSGILNIRGTIAESTFRQVQRQFKNEYSGTENAGKTLLLKGMDGLDFQKLGMELDGAALKELKDMTRDDIMLMFRVSKTMLGVSEGVSVSNAQENRIMFTENVIKPELDRLVDALQPFIVEAYGVGFKIDYEDYSMITDSQRLEMYVAGHNKWLTTNDIREETGYEPLPGGDVIREPVQLMPTSGPAKSNTGKKLSKGLKKKEHSDRVAVFHKLLFDNQAQWEAKYKQYMTREFHKQLSEILAKKKSAFSDWTFDIDASKQRIVGSLVPFGIEVMEQAAKFAFDLADDPDASLELNASVLDFIHDRVDRFAEATNDETVRSIEDTIAQGVADGESIGQLKSRIQDVYAYADDVRAERIARTETLAASNAGANEAYKQSPLVIAKEWSAESDACEFCASLDGTVVGLEEDFAKTGQDVGGDGDNAFRVSYENLEYPPLHPNCQCAIIPVAQ